MGLMEQIAAKTLPPGASFDWTAMSYQEKVTGNQIYFVFALAILLVYLVLAGQYESCTRRWRSFSAVPLALTGPSSCSSARRRQQSLYPDRPHPPHRAVGKNAILIVEFARDIRNEGRSMSIGGGGGAAAVPADPDDVLCLHPRRPPLVIATGAGARRRKSIGVAVFSGMSPRPASPCSSCRRSMSSAAVRGMAAARKAGAKLKDEAGSSLPV